MRSKGGEIKGVRAKDDQRIADPTESSRMATSTSSTSLSAPSPMRSLLSDMTQSSWKNVGLTPASRTACVWT